MFLDGASDFEIIGLWITFFVAIAGLMYALFLKRFVDSRETGNEKMNEVSAAILKGAEAYLRRQLRTVAIIIVVLAVALFFTAWMGQPENWIAEGHTQGEWTLVSVGRMLAFLMGAGFSAAVGYFGMRMAVKANVRVAQASRRSLNEAVTIGYRTGAIVGMLTDGLGLMGGTIIFMIYDVSAPEVLLGFGFGGTLIALFMRVGGGIYTKAADVGADLVGKVEKNIPEDDPRNAAVIADNVGDNVGDCAGMAADIFESYEVTMVSAMILGLAAFEGNRAYQYIAVVFPLLIRAIGVLSSIVGTYAVHAKEGVDVMKSIHKGYMISATISIVGFWAIALLWVEGAMGNATVVNLGIKFAIATSAGIAMAVVINYLTDYFTSTRQKPVKEIVEATNTGSATTILQGLATGMESSVWALFVIVGAMVASAMIFPLDEPFLVAYGVALCGIGMLTLTGNTISMDTFGPIADNANGIGEMANLEPEARQRMADMDAVGNTTKAITKGIAIGSAVVAATCLFMDFVVRADQAGSALLGTDVDSVTGMLANGINISSPVLFAALLIGGAIPFLFSSMCIRAVGRAAQLIVVEVRRQFREIKGLWEGTAKADYEKPVEICTSAAQKELIGLGLLAVLSPIIIGLVFNEVALGAFLGGAILSAQLMAVFMANAGGAWDNAKKSVEDEPRDIEKNTGKGSERHKASVVGDTVGDPLKDTAGPALNPMVKVINLIAVLIVPVVVKYSLSDGTAYGDMGPTEALITKIGVIGGVAAMIIGLAVAVWYSKKR
jgi:K(+)-stimulated pyrophosphate-energized sodium pump